MIKGYFPIIQSLFLALVLVGCGAEDVCVSEDFVGAFTGEVSCLDLNSGQGQILTGSVIISQAADGELIMTDSGTGESYPLLLRNCSASYLNTINADEGLEIEVVLEGDNLDYIANVTSTAGARLRCTGDLLRMQ